MFRSGLFALALLGMFGCDEVKTTSSKRAVGTGQVELLVFHAEWCAPCKQLRPTLDELRTQYPGVKFRFVDIDREVDVAREFNVGPIPHLVVLIDNVIEETLRGLLPRDTIAEALDRALARSRNSGS